MKVVTNSVLTVELDNKNDKDFLVALKKISRRDNITLEKTLECVVLNFLSGGGEPPPCKNSALIVSQLND